ncbi:proteasome assembly chaperone family protein [Candidatus Bathyarchaeota archaeon]|nr:proteasome assembly chaperone family protein [Candidatus Bathyarchaeota archaeon]
MKQTIIREKTKVTLKNPLLIEGLPGLGSVGKITVTYLIRQLRAQKLADLYSPFFPYHVIVDQNGSARLLRGEFFYWKNKIPGKNDLILLTGDSQAQTLDGQYDIANKILSFAERHNVKTILTVGGYAAACVTKEPRVIGVASSKNLLDRLVEIGVSIGPPGTPIVGTAGLLVGLAKFWHINAICLLAETTGYMADPKAAKNVINVLQKFLDLDIDISDLECEIQKSGEALRKVEEVEKKLEFFERTRRKPEGERITYIS